jgi:hypothetical protein
MVRHRVCDRFLWIFMRSENGKHRIERQSDLGLGSGSSYMARDVLSIRGVEYISGLDLP